MRTCIAVLLLVALTARDPQAQATPAQTGPAQAQTAETPEQVTEASAAYLAPDKALIALLSDSANAFPQG